MKITAMTSNPTPVAGYPDSIKPVASIAPRIQTAITNLNSVVHRLEGCTAKVNAFMRGTFGMAPRLSAASLSTRLGILLNGAKSDNSVNPPKYADIAAQVFAGESETTKISGDVDSACKTVK